jgi:hypothetical protein
MVVVVVAVVAVMMDVIFVVVGRGVMMFGLCQVVLSTGGTSGIRVAGNGSADCVGRGCDFNFSKGVNDVYGYIL